MRSFTIDNRATKDSMCCSVKITVPYVTEDEFEHAAEAFIVSGDMLNGESAACAEFHDNGFLVIVVCRDMHKVGLRKTMSKIFNRGSLLNRVIEHVHDTELCYYYVALLLYIMNCIELSGTFSLPTDIGATNCDELISNWRLCQEKAAEGFEYVKTLDCAHTAMKEMSIPLASKSGGMYAAFYAMYLSHNKKYLTNNKIKLNYRAIRDLARLAEPLEAANIFDLNEKIKDL